jgi:hypothetical protein
MTDGRIHGIALNRATTACDIPLTPEIVHELRDPLRSVVLFRVAPVTCPECRAVEATRAPLSWWRTAT